MEDDAACPVCMEPLASRMTTHAPCSHSICLHCLLKLPPPLKCPLCRSDWMHLVPTPSQPVMTEIILPVELLSAFPLELPSPPHHRSVADLRRLLLRRSIPSTEGRSSPQRRHRQMFSPLPPTQSFPPPPPLRRSAPVDATLHLRVTRNRIYDRRTRPA